DVTEVLAVEETVADGVTAKVYSLRLTDGKTGDRMEAKALGNGRLLQMTFGGLIEIRLEPEALAKNIEYSGDLFTSGLARPDKKLGEPGRVKSLVLRLHGADEVPFVSDGRQTAVRERDGALLLSIRRAPPREALAKATPEEIAEARRPTLQHPCDHPEIREAAARAVGGARTDAEKAEALVRFVSSYVEDALSLVEITALDVLHTRRGDCSEHTVLFVALARAAGLAAREVSGWMYGGDALRAFGGHAWAEVVLDGRWVALDPTWTQTEVDATHVRLGVKDQAEAMIRLHGKVRIEVVAVETDG
ncbi:MAG: transglutaminase-like domain-containing protein, partial [Planctomycetales bacterium]|nr:transglutaminase-like domain-containing protein [Planctomycetales bacterium]